MRVGMLKSTGTLHTYLAGVLVVRLAVDHGTEVAVVVVIERVTCVSLPCSSTAHVVSGFWSRLGGVLGAREERMQLVCLLVHVAADLAVRSADPSGLTNRIVASHNSSNNRGPRAASG